MADSNKKLKEDYSSKKILKGKFGLQSSVAPIKPVKPVLKPKDKT